MGDISEHFSRSEFSCSCGCGFDCVDAELLRVLEYVRSSLGKPVTITGPNRCEKHNSSTPGASSGSMHTKGMAVDFRVEGIHADLVAEFLEATYPQKYGIGRYVGRTHLDVRAAKARWDNR
jgi:uncharacterized protein YcbK (DUF882 family)